MMLVLVPIAVIASLNAEVGVEMIHGDRKIGAFEGAVVDGTAWSPRNVFAGIPNRLGRVRGQSRMVEGKSWLEEGIIGRK